MTYHSIIRVLILLGVLQGLIYNGFVFYNRKKFDASIKYLNVVVLALSLNNLREFVFDGDFFSDFFIYCYLSVPWHLLVVPMFYVFIIRYLKVPKSYPSFLRLTYVILIAEIISRVTLMVFSTDFESIFPEYMIFEEIGNAIYSIFIFYFIMKLLFFDEKALKDIISFNNIRWLQNIIKCGAVIIVLWVFALVYYALTREAWVYDPLKILYSALIYWLGYQGLIHWKVTNERLHIRKQLKTKPLKPRGINAKHQTVNGSLNDQHKRDFQKLERYIIEQERYLDPLFSLEKLAQEVNLSVSHISKLINRYSEQNFSDFINTLRIHQAKKLLVHKDYKNYTNVAIGLECGFNSKSTFYYAFRKFTSQTPTAYRSGA